VPRLCIGFACRGSCSDSRGNDLEASEDELKALGTAAATSGSVALFHVVGVTPEAPTLEAAAGGTADGLPKLSITPDDLSAVLDRLCTLEIGQPIAAVCLGTPHFSLTEFAGLARLLDGRRRDARVEVYVSTSREIAATVEADPEFASLARFGVKIVVDTCTYVTRVVRSEQGAILTNSAKWAHYAPGNMRQKIGLMTLERCIRSAESGRVAP